MSEALTEEMLSELVAEQNIQHYVETHDFAEEALAQYLQRMLEEKGLQRAAVVRAAGMNETFGYQVFTGTRGASRNKVLALAFALGLDVRETNRALRAAGASQLYCKNRRDAIIIFCLNMGCSLLQVESQLYTFGEETIC